jgi:hypothetical protein
VKICRVNTDRDKSMKPIDILIRGSSVVNTEVCSLPLCDAVQPGRALLTFMKNVVPPFSRRKSNPNRRSQQHNLGLLGDVARQRKDFTIKQRDRKLGKNRNHVV